MRTLFCEKIGTGSPLVFLHGFCETHQIWDSFIEELTPHFTILLFDLPGFGSSRPLNRQFTIDEVGREVIAELDHLKIDSCVVVGHSLGGYVALAMQSIRPTLFAGIVLFHSTVFADSEEKKLNRDKTIDFVEKYGVAPFVETFVPNLFYSNAHPAISLVFQMALSTPQQVLINYTMAMRDRPTCENLTGYKALILAGNHDSVVPLTVSKKMASLPNKPALVCLPSSGHMGMFEDKPDALNAIAGFARGCFDKN
jgi:pimeloyl-ACP methyl ester carboxylesterase